MSMFASGSDNPIFIAELESPDRKRYKKIFKTPEELTEEIINENVTNIFSITVEKEKVFHARTLLHTKIIDDEIVFPTNIVGSMNVGVKEAEKALKKECVSYGITQDLINYIYSQGVSAGSKFGVTGKVDLSNCPNVEQIKDMLRS